MRSPAEAIRSGTDTFFAPRNSPTSPKTWKIRICAQPECVAATKTFCNGCIRKKAALLPIRLFQGHDSLGTGI